MSVGVDHPDYEAWLPRWKKMRDVAAGEAAIKAGGETYLYCPPQITGDTSRYKAYKDRSEFVEAVGPSIDFVVSRLFAEDPAIDFDGLDGLADQSRSLARQAARELAAIGRFGVGLDYVEGEPKLFSYKAEAIVNWRFVGALIKFVVVEQERDLDIDSFEHKTIRERVVLGLDENGLYYTEAWRQTAEDARDKQAERWERFGDRVQPTLPNGQRLDYVPFHLFSTSVSGDKIEASFLEPLANTTLRYYETSAWHRQGLYLAGNPTPWRQYDPDRDHEDLGSECMDCGHISLGDECGKCGSTSCKPCADDAPVLGSDSLQVLEKGCAMGYMEVEGSGFDQLRKELDGLVEKMVSQGAVMMRLPRSGNEKATATAENRAERVEVSKMRALGLSIDAGFMALAFAAADFVGLNDAKREALSFEVSRRFGKQDVLIKDVIDLATAWAAAKLPMSLVFRHLQNADFIPSDWNEQRFMDELETNRFPDLAFDDDLDADE